jgi:PIN domain nuclease of toxin-antitoxin system
MGRSLLILLDTHVVVWLASDDPRLSKRAQATIAEARRSDQGLAISDFTLFELSTLFRKRHFGLTTNPESFLSEVERRFVVIPITSRICVRALSLPPNYPKDPADRIIGATALVQGLTLVTAEQAIRKSGVVPTIW